MPDPFQSLLGIGDATAQRDVPLANCTTWKVGGPAMFMMRAGSRRAVSELLQVTGDLGLPLLVLGRGSNILVSDRGFAGVVLRLEGGLATAGADGDVLKAGGGALLDSVVVEAYRSLLCGLEFVFGIPGTVGGAVMMNAGAFSRSTSDVLAEARTVAPGGDERHYEAFDGKYRQPLVPEGEIVTEVAFRLSAGSAKSIRERMDESRDRRKATQPWGVSTAGSVFKNPPGAHAGKLIDECGLKGRSVGGAMVSKKHANFIINQGGASARDIKELMDLVAGEVRSRFDVQLEPEVRLVGFEEE
ncbi:MAG: UDP-N-acetylmuramate dehydrogenase [Actinobacteria bacterium]|nr:UDP-N-acetylmuramate dehydrogenase [Actinomycetota bacterium]